MAKVCCEAMGIKLTLLQGLGLVKNLDDMLRKDMSEAEILVLPTNISSDAEFHSRVPNLLMKLAGAFGLVHSAIVSQNRTRGEERLHAVVSPNEFRWAGGDKKIFVGAMSLSLHCSPSETDPVLVGIVCIDERPPAPAPGCSNKLLFQFKGRNGWMGGLGDPTPEPFYHVGRPEYNRFSKKPQPAFDKKKLRGEVDMLEFDRFLAGNTCPISVFSDFLI